MIEYVLCRQRIGVDIDRCVELYGVKADEVPELLRKYVVTLIRQSEAWQQGALVGLRRDADYR